MAMTKEEFEHLMNKGRAERSVRHYEEDPAAYADLKLEDLRADHDLYYCSFVSVRLKNILRYFDFYTPQDISTLTKKDFMRFKYVGTKTCDELEAILTQCGLGWANGHKTYSIHDFSDEEIIDEIIRRKDLFKKVQDFSYLMSLASK